VNPYKFDVDLILWFLDSTFQELFLQCIQELFSGYSLLHLVDWYCAETVCCSFVVYFTYLLE